MVLDYIAKDDGILLDAKTMTLFNARNVLDVSTQLKLLNL